MPFIKDQHCSQVIQTAISLMEPNCQFPRASNLMHAGVHGVNLVSCSSHAQPLTQEDALRLWNLIPVTHKTNPQNALHAQSLSLLAQMAAQSTPQGCTDLLPNGQSEEENVTFYHTLGSPLFKVRQNAHYFISFMFLNTDQGHRVKWQVMTGKEQYEWYDAFITCGETYLWSQTRVVCVAPTPAAFTIKPNS